jgi:hypothetical protein
LYDKLIRIAIVLRLCIQAKNFDSRRLDIVITRNPVVLSVENIGTFNEIGKPNNAVNLLLHTLASFPMFTI